MESMKGNPATGNALRAQVVQMPVPKARRLLLQVEQRVYRSWVRGRSEKSIAREFGIRRHEVEEIARRWSTGQELAA